ncbi:MAG TPA: acyl-CoA dehydrogenase [Streptosporangiaceae bacterium]|nr:acyl-CoA dehydrogenase [Streptosporangiaceae bacterium]
MTSAAEPMPALTAEQEQFAAALHDALGAADVPGAARRWADCCYQPGRALWRTLAGLGVTGLAVAERWGGAGASLADAAVACEELGRHALPGPVPESVAAVPALLAALADDGPANERGDELAGRWLPGLAAGDLMATLALPPWLPYAADAGAADVVLLAEEDVLWLARPGEPRRSVDPARTVSPVTGREKLAGGPAVTAATARALDAGALACAAQLLGAGRALLAASVRHAGQRVQFGRPVGAFQAVQHQLAGVAIGLEFARPLLGAAAATLAAGGSCAARDVSAAKVACTDAACRAARVALQVHGAIGYTQEHDLHLWLTKVRALTGAWGSQSWHRARVLSGDLSWI